MRRKIDNKPKHPDSLLKLCSAIMKLQKAPKWARETKESTDSSAQLKIPSSFPPFQTCLRLQCLLQMRAGWSVWRSAVWQMERCHRWRGVSTAAAASGGEARDRDTPKVRAAQCVTVIGHCDAASLEYKICNNAHFPAAQYAAAAAALQHYLRSADYTTASRKMWSHSVVIKTEILHWNLILFFQLHKSRDAIGFLF